MEPFVWFVAYLLSCMGLTVLIVWPEHGPSAWIRDRVLRRLMPSSSAEVLDCYICSSFWCSLLMAILWWCSGAGAWCWAGCLMTPAAFWLVLRPDVHE